MGTVNILEISRINNIKRVIYASSIYSTSQGGFYRCSKRAAEDYIDEYYKDMELPTILRYGSTYGERATGSNGIYKF